MTRTEMQSLAGSIAGELNKIEGMQAWNWHLSDGAEGEPSADHIETSDGATIFLSDTWGGKGKVHAIASCPRGIEPEIWSRACRKPNEAYGAAPSINMSATKSPAEMARDIARRLVPDMVAVLKVAIEKDTAEKDYCVQKRRLVVAVAELLGVKSPDWEKDGDAEVVRGRGRIDVQVTGKDSMRLYGHCMYVTLEQLRRIRDAVPELFEPERTEPSQ